MLSYTLGFVSSIDNIYKCCDILVTTYKIKSHIKKQNELVYYIFNDIVDYIEI